MLHIGGFFVFFWIRTLMRYGQAGLGDPTRSSHTA